MQDVPDELIDQILADPSGREMLEQLLKANKIEQPLDELPRETLRSAVADLLTMLQQSQGGGADSDIPDELVDQVFSDPEAQPVLQQVMEHHELQGAPADLPVEAKRAIVKLLIDQGVIQFGEKPE
jgi:non-canonical (house-cleaning) NTP pyrophosphatase